MLRDTSAASTSSKSVVWAGAPPAAPSRTRNTAAQRADLIGLSLSDIEPRIGSRPPLRKGIAETAAKSHILGQGEGTMRIAQTRLAIDSAPPGDTDDPRGVVN